MATESSRIVEEKSPLLVGGGNNATYSALKGADPTGRTVSRGEQGLRSYHQEGPPGSSALSGTSQSEDRRRSPKENEVVAHVALESKHEQYLKRWEAAAKQGGFAEAYYVEYDVVEPIYSSAISASQFLESTAPRLSPPPTQQHPAVGDQMPAPRQEPRKDPSTPPERQAGQEAAAPRRNEHRVRTSQEEEWVCMRINCAVCVEPPWKYIALGCCCEYYLAGNNKKNIDEACRQECCSATGCWQSFVCCDWCSCVLRPCEGCANCCARCTQCCCVESGTINWLYFACCGTESFTLAAQPDRPIKDAYPDTPGLLSSTWSATKQSVGAYWRKGARGRAFLFLMLALVLIGGGVTNIYDSIMDDPNENFHAVLSSKIVRISSNLDHLVNGICGALIWPLIPRDAKPGEPTRKTIMTIARARWPSCCSIFLCITGFIMYMIANWNLEFSSSKGLAVVCIAYIFVAYPYNYAFYVVVAMLLEDKTRHIDSFLALLYGRVIPASKRKNEEMTNLLNALGHLFSRPYWPLIEIAVMFSMLASVTMSIAFVFALYQHDPALYEDEEKLFFFFRTFAPIVTNTFCMMYFVPLLYKFDQLRDLLLEVNKAMPKSEENFFNDVRIRNFGYHITFSRHLAKIIQVLTLVGPAIAIFVKPQTS